MLWKEYEDVLLEREDNVATILLNNPANMNPVTVSTMDHLVDALTLCEEDDTVRVIVLRGAGGNFSAGGNVKGMKERLDKGMITAAAPKEELEDLVKKYIKKYSQGPAVAYAQIKRMINSCTMRELNACMQEEVEAQFICSKTEDYRIAVEAFCEKKKPEFVGR